MSLGETDSTYGLLHAKCIKMPDEVCASLDIQTKVSIYKQYDQTLYFKVTYPCIAQDLLLWSTVLQGLEKTKELFLWIRLE